MSIQETQIERDNACGNLTRCSKEGSESFNKEWDKQSPHIIEFYENHAVMKYWKHWCAKVDREIGDVPQ